MEKFSVVQKHPFFAGCAAAVLCEILFGFSFLFTKKATDSVNPCDLLGWRFITAAGMIVLCACCGWIKLRFQGKKLKPLLCAGIFFPGAYYIFEAFGIQFLAASEAGILVASVPAITLFLSIIFLKERPGLLRISGIFLSIAGVILCTTAKSQSATFSPAGYILIGCGILSFCTFTILTRKIAGFTDMEKTFVFLLEAGFFYFAIAVIRNLFSGTLTGFFLLPFRNADLLRSVLYLATACSILCMFLCNFSIRCIGPARFTSFIGIETVVSISAGILILKEQLYPQQLWGAVIVIAGVYLANALREKKAGGA